MNLSFLHCSVSKFLNWFLVIYLQSKVEKHFIHNHLAFVVKYHRDRVTELARIVGFEVKPYRL